MKPAASLLALILVLAMAPAMFATTVYTGILLGSNEVPSNSSPATGNITVTLNSTP
jgi:hypothetical protein